VAATVAVTVEVTAVDPEQLVVVKRGGLATGDNSVTTLSSPRRYRTNGDTITAITVAPVTQPAESQNTGRGPT